MFKRDLTNTLINYARFPVVALLGPRQSGKTTLVKNTFKNHRFITFEDADVRSLALTDPRGFLRIHENEFGIIIDEFQYVPQILSYIQLEVDEKKRPGYFILTGSQNFLMNQAITQSLAGRVGILNLLPLSLHELSQNALLPELADQAIVNGGYPRIYSENISPIQLYPSYIQSYIERDVRQLINVGNLNLFQRFIQLCAGRVGRELNLTVLGNDCGISYVTARSWLSILEASYIVFLLQPHYQNFNKRITKTPKLYFFDTGIVCSLLRIYSPEVLSTHPLRGNIFECFIIADLYKQYCNKGLRPALYFWQDQNGKHEIDCIIDTGLSLVPVEIKSGETVNPDYFKGLKFWKELTGIDSSKEFVIYGADHTFQQRNVGTLLGWKAAATLVDYVQPI